MKEIRILETSKPHPQYYGICFRCDETLCDKCRLKFRCYTDRERLILIDKALYDWLRSEHRQYTWAYGHRKARKVFFEWVIKR